MEIIARLANLPGALPGACAQGLIWGIMAIGVYLTYRILDVADLTVDGSFGTGGAVCVMCLLSGMNVWAALLVAVLAGLATGLVTGLLHTFMGIPAILAGILTQLALYSINLKIMGKANQSINVDKYGLLISLRWVKEFALHNPIIMVILATAVVIGVLYWFFGTELGCGIRATGSNPAMSRAQGINTNFNIVLGLAVSNALVALSGALLLSLIHTDAADERSSVDLGGRRIIKKKTRAAISQAACCPLYTSRRLPRCCGIVLRSFALASSSITA